MGAEDNRDAARQSATGEGVAAGETVAPGETMAPGEIVAGRETAAPGATAEANTADRPGANGRAFLARVDEHEVEPTPFGRLVWMVAGRFGNSATMTVGRCYIDPGQANPRHRHPNCDEILHVLQGEIEHSTEDERVRMGTGDTISIPSGVVHNARNIGTEQAIFVISFSSPDRQTIPE